jgi:outer membrane protein assembly factor BamB
MVQMALTASVVSRLAAVAGVMFCGHLSAVAGNWPQYRGPGACGLDESLTLATNWNIETGTNVRWQAPLPGLAHASPIVWGDRIYVATAVKPGKADLKVGLYGDITPLTEKDVHQWRLLALEKATGKIVWNVLGYEGVPRAPRHPKGTACNSTPATDGNHIAAIFGSEGLFCFDMKGKLMWRKDLGPMDSGFYVVPGAQWGFASSPILVGDKVIVLCDVLTKPFIVAYDLADGNQVWRTERKDMPTWGTPTLVETPQRKQVVVNGWHWTGGYDVSTGQSLWHLDGGGDIPVPTPIFAQGLIYLTSGHGKYMPMRAVRPDAVGDITPSDPGQTNASIAWAYAKRGNYMQTPIAVGDFVFACTDWGAVTCFDAATGAVRFSERFNSGGQGFTASPVSDGKHVYFTSEQGVVFVVAAAGKYLLEAKNELDQTCLATPAISDGTLFFRTQGKLIAIGKP